MFNKSVFIVFAIILVLLFVLIGCMRNPNPNEATLLPTASSSAISKKASEAPIKPENLDSKIDQYLKEIQYNGSILIVKNGKIVISKGYGMANFENKIPNMPNTIFRIGSITKQFTAVSILQLQEQGLLNVEDTLNKYISDYPSGNKITLRHLLTHTSGIAEHTVPKNLLNLQKENAPKDIIDLFKKQPLDFKPGTRFNYSNSNYVLLGYVIEQMSGVTYAQYIADHIFKPLQMNNSSYDKNDFDTQKHATGYVGSNLNYFPPAYKIDMSVPYAAGAISSTVEDLYLWDQALYTTKLLTKTSIDTMFTPFLSGYAFGWIVSKIEKGVVEHGGGIPGYTSLIRRNMNEMNTVILLSNFENDPKLEEVAIKLAEW